MIRLTDLSYRYAPRAPYALAGCSLAVARGELVVVAGPSGAGKSSLLKVLNGLVPHFHGGVVAGRARVAGRDPVALGPRGMSSTVGFVFQDPESQLVTERVEDELAFALESFGFPRAEMARRIEAVLEELSLTPLRHRPVATLSGGERQRVALASALTLAPEVLVLDEPTSQLDPEGAERVLAAVERLNRERGLTVVVSEHRLERLAPHARRLVYLPAAGAPPRVGPLAEILPEIPLAPPLVRLARRLGWQPVPLTVEAARPAAAGLELGDVRGRRAGLRGGVPVLAARGLALGYGSRTILSELELELAAGEVVALAGANGSGKSTLLKGLVGLLPPRRGRVELRGRDIRPLALTEVTAEVGFLPQNPARLLFQETVREEVLFTRRTHGLPLNGPPKELLRRLDLTERAETHPRDLSTGERQRAALAAILAAEPAVLLADEPTRGLDLPRKEELARLLGELAAAGTAVVVATHDVELIARVAHRMVLLDEGGIAADGPVGEVMAAHPAFASQISRLLGDPRLVTEDDVLAAVGRRETGG